MYEIKVAEHYYTANHPIYTQRFKEYENKYNSRITITCKTHTYTKNKRMQINHKVMLRLMVVKGWVGVEEKRQLAELLLQSLDGAS